MTPRIHRLKTWCAPFAALWSGDKLNEVRVNDRGYMVGDVLHLREWDPGATYTSGAFTGRAVLARVSYVSEGGTWGLPANLCVMSLSNVTRVDRYRNGLADAHEGSDWDRLPDGVAA